MVDARPFIIGAMIVIIGFLVFLGIARATESDQVELPYPAILDCWNIDNAKKVTTYLGDTGSQVFFVMEIDTNNDGKKDGLLLYLILSRDGNAIEMTTQPVYVILDFNVDGKPDKAFFDKTMKGACKELIEVPLSALLKDHQ